MSNDRAQVALSTSEAFYRDQAGASPTAEWKQVRVVLGEMEDGTYALIVCPVLDCGLIVHPPLPLIELFLPELDTLVDGQECDRTVHITRRIVPRGSCGASDFYLQFQSSLDYWSFMDVVSEVKLKEASRLEDYRSQLSHIYDTIPSHSSTRAGWGLCSNAVHVVPGTPSSGATTTLIEEELEHTMRCGD